MQYDLEPVLMKLRPIFLRVKAGMKERERVRLRTDSKA